MQAHIRERPAPRTHPTADADTGATVTPVGTFAAGQSPQGSFHVAAEADLGSYASGLAEAKDGSETA